MAALSLWTPRAWLPSGWADDVLLESNAQGQWTSVRAGVPAASAPQALKLRGALLPGLVNAHSHAFQRAIAGLTERRAGGHDDFWSWRDRMYRAALRIDPDQLEAIAAQLYAELLQSGYTQVCEFHYVHHDPAGRAYANPAEMSLALVRAAQRTGIGLTLLPTLYMHAGFGGQPLRDDQRRFASTPQQIADLVERIDRLDAPGINTGLALHSLRAVGMPALRDACAAIGPQRPVHIHIAEQTQEVDACIAACGARPVEWLLEHAPVDARWHLVHATHASETELQGAAHAGASVVICPSTEANLGDGFFKLPAWQRAGGRWSVGSDSHVSRCWTEELRLLEYGQRLLHRQRNVAAGSDHEGSTAAQLLSQALEGGAAACGLRTGALASGFRADACEIDTGTPALLGVPPSHALDALVFSSPGPQCRAVWVAGRAVQPERERIGADFARTMTALWC
ncbi:MAG: formimidoylglutamate deiminase [Betaproteobacteria bacterium]|jgi:formimidoylglutamate deiminase|nr:formimidoylglutamate deiminase [Betaproteobacteria bacterium]